MGMSPIVRTEDLADAQELAMLLGLTHPNSVSTYQRRYPDMPRPVLDLGPGRPKLWLRPHVATWAETRRKG
jgi:glutathione-regulated potassium-efflux system ancillary protein KefG